MSHLARAGIRHLISIDLHNQFCNCRQKVFTDVEQGDEFLLCNESLGVSVLEIASQKMLIKGAVVSVMERERERELSKGSKFKVPRFSVSLLDIFIQGIGLLEEQ